MPQPDSEIPQFYSVIPAGGVGSRLWPLSRSNAPKFLHDLTGSGQSLLRDTWDRLAPLSGEQRIMVVMGRAHRRAVEEQLPELADPNVVLESEPRDSAAAICLAAAILERREPGVIIGSFAADHVIGSQPKFHKAVRAAVAAAEAGYIATIGITPTEPAVGFGYIQAGDALELPDAPSASSVQSGVRAVRRFVEKPDLVTARSYLESGEYLWNAGMFIARAAVLLEQLGRSEPELLAGLQRLAEAWDTPSRGAVVDEVWPRLKKIAIDYAVAEQAAAEGRMAVVPAAFSWDDVGDFASLARLHSGGKRNQLAILGEGARVLADASSGVVVSETGRLISVIGVQDIVVVDTADALLITTAEHAQRVKQVVDGLRLAGDSDVL